MKTTLKSILFMGAALLLALPAHAQIISSWNGNSGQDWGDLSNWNNGIPGNGDTAVFGGGAGTTDVLLQGLRTVDTLNFTSADAYFFDGPVPGINTLFLESGNITSITGSSQIIRNNLTHGAAGTWNLAGTLTLNGALTGGFDLVKSGGGTLTLSGDGTGYTNDISVQAGSLELNSPAAISTSTNIALSGSANLIVNQLSDIGSLSGSGGLVTLNAALDVGKNGALSFFYALAPQSCGGVISGTGDLTLGAANTFTGTTDIEGSKIILNNALALQNSTVNLVGPTGNDVLMDDSSSA